MATRFPGLTPEQSDELEALDRAGTPFVASLESGALSVRENRFAKFLTEERQPEPEAPPAAPSSNRFAKFLTEEPEPPKPPAAPGVVGRLKDTAVDLAKGVVGLGESVVGLGDLATFGLIGKGLEKIGYDPKSTGEFLSGLQSEARQKAEKEVAGAKGFWNTLVALGINPSVLIGNIVQSVPGTIGAGATGGIFAARVVGRAAAEAEALGLSKLAAEKFIMDRVKMEAGKITAAASAGEGLQSAGSIAEAGRQAGKDWSEYAAPAVAGGAGTAVIGYGGGRLATKLGLGNVETDIAARAAGAKGAGIGTLDAGKRILGEGAAEGLLQEMPQSYQEKVFENLATGKPALEGASEAAATGLLAGAGMGAGHAILSGRSTPAEPPAQTPPAAPAAPAKDPIKEILSSDTPGAMIDAANKAVDDALSATVVQPETRNELAQIAGALDLPPPPQEAPNATVPAPAGQPAGPGGGAAPGAVDGAGVPVQPAPPGAQAPGPAAPGGEAPGAVDRGALYERLVALKKQGVEGIDGIITDLKSDRKIPEKELSKFSSMADDWEAQIAEGGEEAPPVKAGPRMTKPEIQNRAWMEEDEALEELDGFKRGEKVLRGNEEGEIRGFIRIRDKAGNVTKTRAWVVFPKGNAEYPNGYESPTDLSRLKRRDGSGPTAGGDTAPSPRSSGGGAAPAGTTDFTAPKSDKASGIVKGETLTFKTEKSAAAYAKANKLRGWVPRDSGDGWVLSKKARTERQLANDAALRRKARTVLPTDNAGAVIAKSGGIRMDELTRDGADPKDIASWNNAHHAKPARKDGKGMSLDGAAEVLAAAGFDVFDEEGRIDATKAREIIDQELMGDKVYTPEGSEILAARRQEFEAAHSPQELGDDGYSSLSTEEQDAVIEALASYDDWLSSATDDDISAEATSDESIGQPEDDPRWAGEDLDEDQAGAEAQGAESGDGDGEAQSGEGERVAGLPKPPDEAEDAAAQPNLARQGDRPRVTEIPAARVTVDGYSTGDYVYVGQDKGAIWNLDPEEKTALVSFPKTGEEKVVPISELRKTAENTGTAPEHSASTGKKLTDEKYPTFPEGVAQTREEIDTEGVTDLPMNLEDFKEATQEWAELLQAPAEKDRIDASKKAREAGFISIGEAARRIVKWRQEARAQGARGENYDKTVISLFDLTGEWARPWAEAGYNVYTFDIQADELFGDVNQFSTAFFQDGTFDVGDVYAVLAAPPCTDFASSGARWMALKDADGRTEASKELIFQTLRTIEYLRPKVWALENPIGRIANLTGLPAPRLSFDPFAFGHPYTKRTLIWGRFNPNLPLAPVEPTEGSKMWSKYGGKSQATKNARSETPRGFAYSFFKANNYQDLDPVTRLVWDYPEVSGAVRAAFKAGVPEADIREMMSQTYENLEYGEARKVLVKAAGIARKGERPSFARELTAREPDDNGLPKNHDALAAQYGFDANTLGWSRGKGMIKGRWMATADGVSSNYFETPEEAIKQLREYTNVRLAGQERQDRVTRAQEAAAEKIRRGENPTQKEWQAAFPQIQDKHTYLRQPEISAFLVKYLGFSPARIRARLGSAAGTLTSDAGAKYPIVYFGKLAEALKGQNTAPAAQDEFSLTGETDAEIRAREELQKREAADRAKRGAAPPPSDFVLTGSDRPADLARARGQMELISDEKAAAARDWRESSDVVSGLTVYASGLSRAADFEAALAKGANVGVDIGELSGNAIERLAAALVKNPDSFLFVDSGAFSLFRANLRAKQSGQAVIEEFGEGGKAMDFDAVHDRYEALELAIARADGDMGSTGAAARIKVVMPDIVGDQAGSVELAKKYVDTIAMYGSQAIVPLQAGDLSLTEMYEKIEGILRAEGKGAQFTIGIPSNEAAAPMDEVIELAKKHGGGWGLKGVHFLGAAADAKIAPRIKALRDAGYDGPISADANLLRAKIGRAGSRDEALGKAVQSADRLQQIPPNVLAKIMFPVEQFHEGEGVKTVQVPVEQAISDNREEEDAYQALLKCVRGA